MARSNWWKQITKNDWQEPSNMTKGEVTAIFCCSFMLFLFMMIFSVLSLSDKTWFIIFMLAMILLGLSVSIYSYVRAAILPNKDNKLYVAGCTTIIITACISLICDSLHAFGLQWIEYSLLTSACLLVNCTIAIIYSVRLNKQAQQEGKSTNSLALLIHMGLGFVPLAANIWAVL